MAHTQSIQHDIRGAPRDALNAYWRLFLLQGVLMVILGAAAIIAPIPASIAVDIFAGWLFFISGVAGLVTMFAARGLPAFLWSFITAALNAAVGVLLIWKPIAGMVSLTLVLAGYFIVEGVFQITASISYREVIGRSWRWMVLSGVADVALAAIIIFNWPSASLWTLGLVIGINLLTSGMAILAVGLAGRSLLKAAQ